MKKASWFLFILLLVCIAGDAFAAGSGGSGSGGGSASSVFSGLSTSASKIGKGLRDVGFIIAGFGLIVFSFMAIFNKISWKTLAYIMMSTFILSSMVGIISYFSGGSSSVKFGDVKSVSLGFGDTYGDSMDTTRAVVDKEEGEATMGQGTGGALEEGFDAPEPVDGGALGEVVVTGKKKQ